MLHIFTFTYGTFSDEVLIPDLSYTNISLTHDSISKNSDKLWTEQPK